MEHANKWHGFSIWGWLLTLVSLLLAIYSFCSFRFFFIWNISPARIYILCLTVIALILGIVSVKSHRNKIRSVLTMLLSIGLILILLISMAFFRVTKMETTLSQDQHYKVSFYSTDSGAGAETLYLGYIDGPLWFKKRFFTAGIQNAPNYVTWKNDFTIVVNNHPINLKRGQVFNK